MTQILPLQNDKQLFRIAREILPIEWQIFAVGIEWLIADGKLWMSS